MTTKTDELKPCPFCGGPGERQSGGEGESRRYGCSCSNWKCVGHASALFHKNQQDAIDQWNTRATLQSQDREDAEFELIQDETQVAWAAGPREQAWAEIQSYAAQYSEDGPVEIWEITRRRIEGEGK